MTAPAYDDQNIFAKILRGEIPSIKVYDDEHTIAFMDVMPQAEGHVLVLPKAASRNILDISTHDLLHVSETVQKIARAVVKAFDAEGVNVIHYGEPAGGQTVFHTHVHVIPRFEGIPLKPHTGGMADSDALQVQADKIIAALGN
ncbi:histidine triad (HIT) family protein [Faunimonas pinastri]|uniref:Histidine triad (HIT) family protein n=1 Tax=Faunimonas pinastri TaxID=1855383 RepID=A0A1H9CHB0_9HYPH|nr:HIT family protein [Faunimonas pinastri]SEQ00595.1 histidine triad (HIT) family protein [Faunimonas pinastri]